MMATKFINPLLGSSFRRSDNGFGAVFDLFPVLSGIQTTGSRVDSTGQCGPTQQVVGNGQEQGNAGDLGHPTHGEALYSVLHSGLSIDTFCCRGSVSIDGLTFPSLHALPPDDHPRLGAWLRGRLLASLPFLGWRVYPHPTCLQGLDILQVYKSSVQQAPGCCPVRWATCSSITNPSP